MNGRSRLVAVLLFASSLARAQTPPSQVLGKWRVVGRACSDGTAARDYGNLALKSIEFTSDKMIGRIQRGYCAAEIAANYRLENQVILLGPMAANVACENLVSGPSQLEILPGANANELNLAGLQDQEHGTCPLARIVVALQREK